MKLFTIEKPFINLFKSLNLKHVEVSVPKRRGVFLHPISLTNWNFRVTLLLDANELESLIREKGKVGILEDNFGNTYYVHIDEIRTRERVADQFLVEIVLIGWEFPIVKKEFVNLFERIGFGFQFLHSLNLSDFVSLIGIRTLTESLTLSEVLRTLITGKSLQDSLSLLDTYSRIWNAIRAYQEEITLLDKIERGVYFTLTDSTSLSDVLNLLLVFVRVLQESLVLSDLIVRATSKQIPDSLSLVDLIERKGFYEKVESLFLSELLTYLSLKRVLETLSLSDALSFIQGLHRVYQDTLSLLDSLLKFISREMEDILQLLDSIEKLATLIKEDYVSSLESLHAIVEVKEPELFQLDISQLDLHRLAPLVRDSVEVIPQLTDSILTSDLIVSLLFMIREESINLSDVLEILGGYLRELEGSISLSDIMERIISLKREYLESISILDSFHYLGIFSYQDSITLSEILNFLTERELIETINLSDYLNLIQVLIRTLTDTLSLTDRVLKGMSRDLLVSLSLFDSMLKSPSLGFQDISSTTESLHALVEIFEPELFQLDISELDEGRLAPLIKDFTEIILSYPDKIESISVSDVLKTVLSMSKQETINLSEIIFRVLSRVYSESISLQERLIRGVILSPYIKTLSLVDSILKSVSSVLEESLSLSEILVRDITRSLVGEISLIALISRSISTSREETVSLFEVFSKSPLKEAIETLSITSEFTFNLTRIVSLTLNLIDSLSVGLLTTKEYLDDTIMILDTGRLDVSKLAPTIRDSVEYFINYSLIKQETIQILDSVIRQISTGQTDSITLQEALSYLQNKNLTESLTLLDSFSRTATLSRTYIESQILQDIVLRYTQKSISPSLSLSDSISTVHTPAEVESTITTNVGWNNKSGKLIVKVGGYWYVFYKNQSTTYIVYKSSSNGSSWSSEANASHTNNASIGSACVIADGNTIILVYPIGSSNSSNPTATTLYVRKGTASNGTITWNSPVSLIQSTGYWLTRICKTNNYFNLAGITYYPNGRSRRYHLLVWRSSNGSSWSEIRDETEIIESGNRAGIAITKHPSYGDGLVLITANYNSSNFKYRTYNGSSWGSSSTFGSKSTGYLYYFEAICKNNQVHLVHLPNNDGGSIKYTYFNGSSWSSEVTIDSSSNKEVRLTALSDKLICYYIDGSNNQIRKREMNYSTHSWSSPSNLKSDSTAYGINSPRTEGAVFVWRTGSSSPYTLKFKTG